MFSYEFFEISKNTFVTEYLWESAFLPFAIKTMLDDELNFSSVLCQTIFENEI